MNCPSNENVLKAINRAISYRVRFYAYRLPGEKLFSFGAQLIDQQSCVGFAINPFEQGVDCQPEFIAAQYSAEAFLKVPQTAMNRHQSLREITNQSTSKEEYITAAKDAIEVMKAGEFDKIVMSRVIVNGSVVNDWAAIFNNLAEKNPDLFIFIYNTPDTGAWLGATPERFLSAHGKRVSCMALAATKPADDCREWTEKEVREQGYVRDYIAECLENMGVRYNVSKAYNRVAGNVQHICNDFDAEQMTPTQIAKLKTLMHPTPAICGLPVNKAVKYITAHEGHDRLYYGGYVGPVDANGDFDFFVNLRSLQFDSSKYCVYAGGGLTAASNAEDEWQETEMKSKLLLNYL